MKNNPIRDTITIKTCHAENMKTKPVRDTITITVNEHDRTLIEEAKKQWERAFHNTSLTDTLVIGLAISHGLPAVVKRFKETKPT